MATDSNLNNNVDQLRVLIDGQDWWLLDLESFTLDDVIMQREFLYLWDQLLGIFIRSQNFKIFPYEINKLEFYLRHLLIQIITLVVVWHQVYILNFNNFYF